MCLFQFYSFLHPMCHRLYIFILSRMWSFIVCFILSVSFVMLSPFRCVIYLMMSFPPECVPLSYVSYVLHCILDCVPSLDKASAFYCKVHPGYVFLSCVDYVLFCLFDSECFLPSDLSYALYCHLHLWCVLSCYGSWALLYLVQSDRVPHPVCHLFYIVMSPLCFILSHVFYVLLCIVYSDCYLHPMCHYVLSCQFHPGYVILFHLIYFQIVLSSSDLLSWFNEMGKKYNHNLHKIRCCDTLLPHQIPVTSDNSS